VDFAFLAIPLFQRALLAGSVLAALLAFLGVLVTARGLAYLGDGLSHAAFGGLALGMFLGLSAPLVVAIPFTALAAVGIGALRRKSVSAKRKRGTPRRSLAVVLASSARVHPWMALAVS
jgi:ABC-type Mn2+/Zn2+ transport system permease subunit